LGFLSTKDENRVISGAQFCSTMFGGRAPDGHVSIACYIGGARNPEAASLPAADMAGLVQAELSGVLGIKGPPVLTRVRHWARGLPQVLESAGQRMPGLILTGNYLRGVSIANCLASARAAVQPLGSDPLGTSRAEEFRTG
jgi:oxygen-dependent protoporphyrinogen oxidase